MSRNEPAVLARVDRHDANGNWTGAGPFHLFNGRDQPHTDMTVRTWCGMKVKIGKCDVLQNRQPMHDGSIGALYADLCRRCFVQPSAKKGGGQ